MTSILPPDIDKQHPERKGQQALCLTSPCRKTGALAELYRVTTGASISEALDIAKAGRGVLATGDWGRMYELGKRYADIGAKTEIVRVIDLMAKDHQHMAAQQDSAADLEAGWTAWSAHIQKVDERELSLLRAAFEAGWEAGLHSSSSYPE